jgi:hypothetical protein
MSHYASDTGSNLPMQDSGFSQYPQATHSRRLEELISRPVRPPPFGSQLPTRPREKKRNWWAVIAICLAVLFVAVLTPFLVTLFRLKDAEGRAIQPTAPRIVQSTVTLTTTVLPSPSPATTTAISRVTTKLSKTTLPTTSTETHSGRPVTLPPTVTTQLIQTATEVLSTTSMLTQTDESSEETPTVLVITTASISEMSTTTATSVATLAGQHGDEEDDQTTTMVSTLSETEISTRTRVKTVFDETTSTTAATKTVSTVFALSGANSGTASDSGAAWTRLLLPRTLSTFTSSDQDVSSDASQVPERSVEANEETFIPSRNLDRRRDHTVWTRTTTTTTSLTTKWIMSTVTNSTHVETSFMMTTTDFLTTVVGHQPTTSVEEASNTASGLIVESLEKAPSAPVPAQETVFATFGGVDRSTCPADQATKRLSTKHCLLVNVLATDEGEQHSGWTCGTFCKDALKHACDFCWMGRWAGNSDGPADTDYEKHQKKCCHLCDCNRCYMEYQGQDMDKPRPPDLDTTCV